MKARDYERFKCKCGWYCDVLKTARASVFHCGFLLKEMAGSEEESNE